MLLQSTCCDCPQVPTTVCLLSKDGLSPQCNVCVFVRPDPAARGSKNVERPPPFLSAEMLVLAALPSEVLQSIRRAHFRPERTVLFHIRCKPKYACACTHGICMRSCVVYPISCNCFLNSLSVRILNIFCKPVSTSSDPKSGDTESLYHTPPSPPKPHIVRMVHQFGDTECLYHTPPPQKKPF